MHCKFLTLYCIHIAMLWEHTKWRSISGASNSPTCPKWGCAFPGNLNWLEDLSLRIECLGDFPVRIQFILSVAHLRPENLNLSLLPNPARDLHESKEKILHYSHSKLRHRIIILHDMVILHTYLPFAIIHANHKDKIKHVALYVPLLGQSIQPYRRVSFPKCLEYWCLTPEPPFPKRHPKVDQFWDICTQSPSSVVRDTNGFGIFVSMPSPTPPQKCSHVFGEVCCTDVRWRSWALLESPDAWRFPKYWRNITDF